MTREGGCLIWLSLVEGLGFVKINGLIRHFGSAEGVWDAGQKKWEEAVGPKLAAAMAKKRDPEKINEYVRHLLGRKIHILTIEDARYPKALQGLDDAPYVLYARGRLELLQRDGIAIVGPRKCSKYGQKVAALFARELAQAGLVIVSGLARGIDCAAHGAALAAGGDTIAVLGCGMEYFYPPENEGLQRQIAEKGLLISEYPPETGVKAWQFPVRNRIIAGLSLGTLLPEAAQNSGSLSTAASAIEYGRELFTVPGQIFSPYSYETNRLLKSSAQVALEPGDVLSVLGLHGSIYNEEKSLQEISAMTKEEKRVVQALKAGPLSFDEIMEMIRIDTSKLNSLLTILEMKEIIVKAPGRVYEMND